MPYAHPDLDFLRKEFVPTVFCPGCGIGIVIHARIEAVKELKIPREKIVNVSGIGCSGRIPQHIATDGVHAIHGRALPVAMGIKLMRPDMYVTVRMGDGDALAIGGNHFIHAARRNLDVLVIMINNRNYGMTGGQVAPTTPPLAVTRTTMKGNFEDPFNAVALAYHAGATFVARRTVAHFLQLKMAIKKGLQHKGFAFIEVLSPCTSRFLHINKADYKKFFEQLMRNSLIRDNTPPDKAIIDRDPETKELRQVIVGNFVEEERPTFYDKYVEIYGLKKK